MEHDDDRYTLARAISGNIDPVSPGAGVICIHPVEKDTRPQTAWRVRDAIAHLGSAKGSASLAGGAATVEESWRFGATASAGRGPSVPPTLGTEDTDGVGSVPEAEDDRSVRWISSVASASRPARVSMRA